MTARDREPTEHPFAEPDVPLDDEYREHRERKMNDKKEWTEPKIETVKNPGAKPSPPPDPKSDDGD